MTMPSLIANYQKRVIAIQLKKTYSDLENLIKKSEVSNGSYEDWDYSLIQEEFVETYFKPYVSLTQCNDKVPCFAERVPEGYIWKLPNGELETEGRYLVYPKYLLSDGRAIAISNHYDNSLNRDWRYVTILVDVNGAKGKSISGQDVFEFTLFNYTYYEKKKGLRFGNEGGGGGQFDQTNEWLVENCALGANRGYSCGLLLQRNGWKFPDNYPIKF